MRFTLPLFSAIVLAAGSISAHATTMDQFTITGQGNAYAFVLPASPTNVLVFDTGSDFAEFSVPLSMNGTISLDDVEFYTAASEGGLTIFNPGTGNPVLDVYQLGTSGTQLFRGSVTAPTFLLGTFQLTDDLGNPTYSVHISRVPAVTPEPSSLLLLGTGAAGLVGTFSRRRGLRT